MNYTLQTFLQSFPIIAIVSNCCNRLQDVHKLWLYTYYIKNPRKQKWTYEDMILI